MLDRRSVLTGAAAGALSLTSGGVAWGAATGLGIRRGRLFIEAGINHVRTRALLDTAAELTVIDRAFAAGIGVSGGQDVEAKGSGPNTQAASIVEGVNIEAAGVVNDRATVALVDLSDVSRRLNGAPISVILGRDYFELARFEVDLPRRIFRAMGANERPRGQRAALTEEFGTLALEVRAEGRGARAAVDLGNGTMPLISRAFASRLGALTDGRPLGLDRGGGIGGAADRQAFQLATLEVSGKTFHAVRVAIDAGQNASDLNLGTSILRHFHMAIDFAQRQMWLERTTS